MPPMAQQHYINTPIINWHPDKKASHNLPALPLITNWFKKPPDQKSGTTSKEVHQHESVKDPNPVPQQLQLRKHNPTAMQVGNDANLIFSESDFDEPFEQNHFQQTLNDSAKFSINKIRTKSSDRFSVSANDNSGHRSISNNPRVPAQAGIMTSSSNQTKPSSFTGTNNSKNGDFFHDHGSPPGTSKPELIFHSIEIRLNGTSADPESSSVKYGFKVTVLIVSLLGATTLALFGIVRCLRATRRASRALALPIPLLPEDRTPLNAEPANPVSMLSVQSPGCAGMERLGVPARTSLGSPPVHDDRSHISRRMRVDALQARDLLVGDSISSDRQARNSSNAHHHYHHIPQHNGIISCPHHVAMPDSEWGIDQDLHLRAPYQTEITRSYIKPPPNRTALDVPEQSYSLYPATSACNLSQRVVTQSSKSKPNPLAKFFLRISSPKTPDSPSRNSTTTIITSSATSSPSTTSSSSSLSTFPVSSVSTTTSAKPHPHYQHYQHSSLGLSGNLGSLTNSHQHSISSTTMSLASSGGNTSTTASIRSVSPIPPPALSPGSGNGGDGGDGGSSSDHGNHI